MSPARPSIVVIGGGIAGLVSAHELARHGARAEVYEAGPRIAGMALENCKRTDYTRAFAARQDALAAGYTRHWKSI